MFFISLPGFSAKLIPPHTKVLIESSDQEMYVLDKVEMQKLKDGYKPINDMQLRINFLEENISSYKNVISKKDELLSKYNTDLSLKDDEIVHQKVIIDEYQNTVIDYQILIQDRTNHIYELEKNVAKLKIKNSFKNEVIRFIVPFFIGVYISKR